MAASTTPLGRKGVLRPLLVHIGHAVGTDGSHPGVEPIGEPLLGLPGMFKQGAEVDRHTLRREDASHLQHSDCVAAFGQVQPHLHADPPPPTTITWWPSSRSRATNSTAGITCAP